MYRIDSANNVPALPAKIAAEGAAGYFVNNPGAGPGTKVTGDWLNTVQEEIIAVILGASIAPDRTNNAQLLAAIQALVAGVMPTGFRGSTIDAAAPAGWVLASGRTIGDAASGATERANADCQALFTLLWNGYDDATYPIFTSGGGASVRGGSAAADWAAHKRMTLPDYRGRAGFGRDDMGGAAANRITVAGGNVDGTVLGKTAGSQNHTLTGAEIPFGQDGTTSDNVGGPVHGSSPSGATAHTIMNPMIIENVIIKL